VKSEILGSGPEFTENMEQTKRIGLVLGSFGELIAPSSGRLLRYYGVFFTDATDACRLITRNIR
jgi:hypothetical protein